MADVPFEVQIELLDLVAEHEDFQKSAKALGVIGAEQIRATLRGIATFLRTAKEAGAYDAANSEVLSEQVKNTLGHLSKKDRERLFEVFGLGDDDVE